MPPSQIALLNNTLTIIPRIPGEEKLSDENTNDLILLSEHLMIILAKPPGNDSAESGAKDQAPADYPMPDIILQSAEVLKDL